MEKIGRVSIFIDGGNLHHRLKELSIQKLNQFRYREFVDSLTARDLVVSRSFYAGSLRKVSDNSYSKKVLNDQQILFNYLKSSEQNFSLKLGKLSLRGGQMQEKGVDVQLAVDMVSGAFEDVYDEALLVSSDSDFIPAIKKVRTLGKIIGYVGFSHKPTRALQWEATFYKLLNREEILPFCRA